MERLRKGNDIDILWEIVAGGSGSDSPYDLTGKNLEVFMFNAYEKVAIKDFKVEGNTLRWTYLGKDQQRRGIYSLLLIENNGKDGMHTVDECQAFELVDHSYMEGGEVESHVRIETLRLKSGITVNGIVPDKTLDANSGNVVENAAVAKEFQRVDKDINTVAEAIEIQGKELTDLGEVVAEHGEALEMLNGDGEGSVKKAVADGIAEVVAKAPDDFDTLKEIADYIASDKTGAAQINNTLDTHEKAIDKLEKEVENINPTPMLSITHAELVELRDAGKLIPGMQYRITDYVTMTTQAETQSAGHRFDVIVTADSATTLNEVARACLHDGDTYFSEEGARLEAWQIWYCLDNDSTRFAWATNDEVTCAYCWGINASFPKECDGKLVPAQVNNEENYVGDTRILYLLDLPDGQQLLLTEDGSVYDEAEYKVGEYEIRNAKGVIYRMIDEWNNDCPYDFKNILFRRGIYDQSINITHDNDEDHTIYAYVFSWLNEDNTVEDLSLIGNSRLQSDEDLIVGVRCNRIGSFHDNLSTGCIQLLNDVVFLDGYHGDGANFYGCYNNTVGKKCCVVSAQANCVKCTIGDECYRIHLHNWTFDNTVGSNCVDIVMYANAIHNEIGNMCSFIFLEEPCGHINIGTGCSDITLSDSTNINIGMNCRDLRLSRVSDSTVINGVQNATLSEFGNSFVGTTSSGKVTSFVLADLVAS